VLVTHPGVLIVAQKDLAEEMMKTIQEDVELQQEWLRQDNLIFGGLIAIGIYMVQPFVMAASLDLSAKICVVAFSVAIPLLASLVVINQQETFRHRRSKSFLVPTSKVVAQCCAFVGFVAGFWHILWIAGVGIFVSGVIGMLIHAAAYWRLELDQMRTFRRGQDSGGTRT
jgi:hypothetical protein